MKKQFIILLTFLSVTITYAQVEPPKPPMPPNPPRPPHTHHDFDVDDNNEDTVKMNFKNYKVFIVENKKADSIVIDSLIENKEHHKKYKSWSGLDFGVNGYLNSDFSGKMPAGYEFLEVNYRRSFCFGLNFFEKDIPIFSDYVKLVTGLGLEWDNYFFSNNTRLTSDSAKIYGFSDSVKFDKTKLRLGYINLPLLLQFNTNADPKKAFHFSAGVIVSYNMGAKTKMIYEINNQKFKEKVSGDYHINSLRYGITASVGYGNFKVFANYNLNGLFVKDEGPDLYPFSVGISILSF